MGLSFGWKAADVRESIWIDDPDLVDVSAAAKQAWQEDGDASHLQPFVRPGGKPTRITFRVLTPDEGRMVSSRAIDSDSGLEGISRAWLLCFRIGGDFPDMPAQLTDASGAQHERIVKEKGVRLLANELIRGLEAAWPGLVGFYGRLIFAATFPTEPEKKASSQPSTLTQSSAATAPAEGTAFPAAAATDAPATAVTA